MYTVLDKELNTVGFLSNRGASGNSDFWDDEINVQIADTPDVTNVSMDLSTAGQNINASGNTKAWNHTLNSISFRNTPVGSQIDAGFFLAYKHPANNRHYLIQLTQVDEIGVQGGEHQKTASGVNQAIYELSRKILKAKTFKNGLSDTGVTDPNSLGSLPNIMKYVTNGTSWKVRIDGDYYGAIDYEISDKSTAVSVLQDVLSQFDVDVDAYVSISSDGVITNKTIHIAPEIGEDTGRLIRWRQHITGITKSNLMNSLYTKLWVYGGNDVTIAGANQGLPYIVDDEANLEYYPSGHNGNPRVYLEGVISNSDILAPNGLLQWGQKQLKLLNHPRANYTVSTYLSNEVALGDTIRVQDLEASEPITISSRVIQQKISFANPTSSEIVLGEFVPVVVNLADWALNLNNTISGLISRLKTGDATIQLRVLTPDGDDFASTDDQKRVIAQVYVGNLNITTFLDDSAFVWTKLKPDGTVDEDWNDEDDNKLYAYQRTVEPSFEGTLRLSIDSDGLSTSAELSFTEYVTATVIGNSAISGTVHGIGNYTLSNTMFKLNYDKANNVWSIFDQQNGLQRVLKNIGNESFSIAYKTINDVAGIYLYAVNSNGYLVTTKVPDSSNTGVVDLNAADQVSEVPANSNVYYDQDSDSYLLWQANKFSVYAAGDDLMEATANYSLNLADIGIDGDSVYVGYHFPYVAVYTTANILNVFNIITASPVITHTFDYRNGLPSGNIIALQMSQDSFNVAVDSKPNNIYKLAYGTRGAFAGAFEASTEELVPNAIETAEMNAVKARVDAVKQSDTIKFGLITDTHIQTGGAIGDVNVLRHIKAISYYAKHYGLDFIVHNGDMDNGNAQIDITKNDITRGVNALKLSGKPFFTVQGNHDNNDGFARDRAFRHESQVIENSAIKSLRTNATSVTVNGSDTNNPYGNYKVNSNIVAIFLNAFDNPNTIRSDGRTATYITHGQSNFRQAQLTWLIGVLNGMSNSQQAIIFSHSQIRGVVAGAYPSKQRSGNVLRGVLQAFQQSTKFSGTGWDITDNSVAKGSMATSVSVDFTGKTKNRIIAVFHGHTHNDSYKLYGKINYITTTSSDCQRSTVNGQKAERVLGTRTEDAWDVVSISPSKRTIDLIRYGWAKDGKDRHYTY